MESKGIIDYFEEVETGKEYKGYVCKVAEFQYASQIFAQSHKAL
jgi:hypothetical protein